ncbi:MAG: hypothetical protein KGJ62_10235 [Armatimonadetes bacterium]|nr:hypothetical protein [Armatimonadota bacterium]MDE2207408.1 hypothetical protein [Armatimonadota bacterium]
MKSAYLAAAIFAATVVGSGCGGGAGPAAVSRTSRPRTVDGITFSQVVAVVTFSGTRCLSITFTVANGTKGSVWWTGDPLFIGTATSADGKVTAIQPPPSGGTSGTDVLTVDVAPGTSQSVTEYSPDLATGMYTVVTYPTDGLFGAAVGPPNGTAGPAVVPGDPATTENANPVTIWVP